MSRLYISATHKSSGKTTLTIGLCRELTRRGHRVQPFKKGPDYIDPLWLGQAAGRPCLNLDFNTMDLAEIRSTFAGGLIEADLGLIEGNVGLFDAVDLDGSNSNAELAKLLNAPVILLVDVQGMSRGLAPILLGYLAFDPELTIAGIILNKVGGSRHETNLRRVVEHYTDLPLLGAIHRESRPWIEERHLGLMPSTESREAEAQIEAIRHLIASQVDIERLLGIAGAIPPLATVPKLVSPGWQATNAAMGSRIEAERVRIGVARDEAFGFYYPDDLEALRAAGAELVPFSPIRDPSLPRVDGLFIGGGFPECRMQELAANTGMRAAVKAFIEAGGPVYAECGGLMYLCRGLRWGEDYVPLCGVLAADVAMHERPQGRGYIRLRELPVFPWPRPADQAEEIRAHEFHHSAIVEPDPQWVYGYEVLRGSGVDGQHDGIIYKNLVASYAHLRHVGGVNWPARFVAQVRRCRQVE
jgi:cobyrinic acid a,c-diamide synthase